MTTMRRWARSGLVSALVLGLASCGESTAPSASAELGRLIARGSLTSADASPLPCCATNASGAQVSVTGGTLNLYALAHFTDAVPTPGGVMSAACVQAVPNGAVMSITGMVTLSDGSSYLGLPCSVGLYRVTLTRQTVAQDGSSLVSDTLIASGSFTWQRDRLTLVDEKVAGVSATLSGANVALVVPGHQYQFTASVIQ